MIEPLLAAVLWFPRYDSPGYDTSKIPIFFLIATKTCSSVEIALVR